jgi:hypothetical protein
MGIALKVASTSRRGFITGRRHGLLVDPPTNPWQPYRLKLLPKRINERWYKPGDMVYRRWLFSPGGGFWQYGDEFDYLRWQP